ncbi:MAG: MerR family transcriptional regulator [Casimicrobium sp.]
MKHTKKLKTKGLGSTLDPSFRSAAVARMVAMPVATLRVWEQRYQAVQPTTASSGHRLYSPADVERVALLRQLTEQGHAIGTIASLDLIQLQQIASASAQTGHNVQRLTAQPAPVLRIAVVGAALALRLQRPTVAQRLRQKVRLVSVGDSLEELPAPKSASADLLLWYAPELLPSVSETLEAAKRACGALHVAVVYRFASASAIKALANLGFTVVKEPADDEAFSVWFNSIDSRTDHSAAAVSSMNFSTSLVGASSGSTPRRYDDATLTTIAGLAPKMLCECPGHIAELLMQLSSFENYSAGCVNNSPEEAQLHAYLQRVAGASRVLFEAALERVARHEGFALR